MPDLTFRRYNAAGARQIRATVEAIYRNSYTDAIASDDPFDTVEAFMGRFDSYTSAGGLDLMIAYSRDDPVGQTWGWPLSQATRVWQGVSPALPEEFIAETGHRTFQLSEIMVCQAYTGQHLAHAMHDELLSARTEERARLLVKPQNVAAYRAYRRWGWRKVAQRRPEWPNAPLYDVLILPLPIA